MVTRTIIRVISPTERALAMAAAATASSTVVAARGEEDLGALIYKETQMRRAEAVEEVSVAAAAHPYNDDDSHYDVSINSESASKKRSLSSEDYDIIDDKRNATHQCSRITIDLTDVPPQSPILRSGGVFKDGSSKYQGVTLRKSNKFWARIRINDECYSLGQYDTEEEAAVVYARAAFKYKAKADFESLQEGKGKVSIDSMADVPVPLQPPILKSIDTDGSLIKFQGVYSDGGNKKWRVWRVEGKKHAIDRYDNGKEDAAIDSAGATFNDGGGKVQQGRSANQMEMHHELCSKVACTNEVDYEVMRRRLLTKTQLQALQTPSLYVEESLENISIMNAPISPSVSNKANPYELELETFACRPKSTIESLMSQVCDSQNFDIAEVWLHDDDGESESYHLAHSYVRTTLNKPLFQSIREVYRNYSEDSAKRTHRLSSALCKWAKKTGQVLRISEHKSPRLFQALKYSVSGVQVAVAVPVCQGGLTATIALFSMTSGVALPKGVEVSYNCYLNMMSQKIVKQMESG